MYSYIFGGFLGWIWIIFLLLLFDVSNVHGVYLAKITFRKKIGRAEWDVKPNCWNKMKVQINFREHCCIPACTSKTKPLEEPREFYRSGSCRIMIPSGTAPFSQGKSVVFTRSRWRNPLEFDLVAYACSVYNWLVVQSLKKGEELNNSAWQMRWGDATRPEGQAGHDRSEFFSYVWPLQIKHSASNIDKSNIQVRDNEMCTLMS
jgi:hypothetical protein